jgi:hypothetical protein
LRLGSLWTFPPAACVINGRNLTHRQRAVVQADFINQAVEGLGVSAKDRLPTQVANPDSILVQVTVAGWVHRPQHPVVRRDVRTVQDTIDVNLDLPVVRISRHGDVRECIQGNGRDGCRKG